MELAKITTVVRPRTKWQATDLGFRMASHWFKPLLSGWLMVTLPIFCLLQLIFMEQSWIAMLIFWWLKPFWERIQLGYLSFAQFGEHTTLKQQFKRWLSVLSKQWFATLTWRRFNLQRSYNAPVIQLESLTGKRLSKRNQLFDGSNQQAAFWLTIVLMHLEVFITLAMYTLMILLIPPDLDIDADIFDLLVSVDFYNHLLAYLSMALVAPFFVAAGFALYLNQRTHIEGWDIEITFRRMLERQQHKSRKPMINMFGTVLLLSLTTVLSSNDALAAIGTQQALPAFDNGQSEIFIELKEGETLADKLDLDDSYEVTEVDDATAEKTKGTLQQRAAKKLAQKIASSEHFNKKETKRYPEFYLDMKVNDQEPDEPLLMPEIFQQIAIFFANSLELIITALVIGLIALLIYRYRYWLAQFAPGKLADKLAKPDKPSSVFGLDINEQSIPEQPQIAAQALWEAGKKRQSLSLLYRASLISLVNRDHVTVYDGFTEGECVAQVKQNAQPQTFEYFYNLTNNWQRLAYAGQLPDDHTMAELFNQWPVVFAEPDHEQ
jgi:hypothetical protein